MKIMTVRLKSHYPLDHSQYTHVSNGSYCTGSVPTLKQDLKCPLKQQCSKNYNHSNFMWCEHIKSGYFHQF